MTVLMAATGHVAVASFSSFSTAWSIFPLPSASTSPAHGVLSVGVAQNFIPFFFFFLASPSVLWDLSSLTRD